MRKTLVVALVVAILVMISTSVFAMTASELVDHIYEKGAKYGVTKADITKMNADIEKRVEANDEITDAEAEAALAKVDEIASLLESKGVGSIAEGKEKLTVDEWNQIQTLAKDAGSVVGVQVSISVEGNKATISIYDPITQTSVLSASVNPETGARIKSPTGASIASAVVASVAVVAVAVVAAVKVKKEA